MEETPSTPTPAPAPTWSITKAEWDALSSRFQKKHLWIWGYVGLTAILGVCLLIVPMALREMPEIPFLGSTKLMCMIIGALFVPLAVYQYFWLRREYRNWDRLHAEIWAADGCVCPFCLARVDTAPCLQGYTRAEHAIFLRYWESKAVKDDAEESKCAVELLGRIATTKPSERALLGFSKWLHKRPHHSAHGGPDATLPRRFRAALPRIVGGYASFAIILGAMYYFDLFEANHFPGLVVLFLFIPPIQAMSLKSKRKAGRLRCTACGHLCASATPTLCPECGSDLTLPAAVSRAERHGAIGVLRSMAPYALLVFLSSAAMALSKPLMSLLPASVQSPIYSWMQPPYDYFTGMNVATMTQDEIDGALEVLISWSAPGVPPPPNGYMAFIEKAMAAGKVPPPTIERAARTVATARLSIVRDGDAVVATVKPEFGTPIFGLLRTVHLVFGGVSIDGETWTRGADGPLSHFDLVQPPLPESQLVFTARLDGVAPGMHTVRARCWIVIWGPQWERYAPVFDESGALVPPAGAVAYPLDLEATVDVHR